MVGGGILKDTKGKTEAYLKQLQNGKGHLDRGRKDESCRKKFQKGRAHIDWSK